MEQRKEGENTLHHQGSASLYEQHLLLPPVYNLEMEDSEGKSFSQGFEASKLNSLLFKSDLSTSRVMALVLAWKIDNLFGRQ